MAKIGIIKSILVMGVSLILSFLMYPSIIGGLWLLILSGEIANRRHRAYLVLGTLFLGTGLGLLAISFAGRLSP
jgi:hypothetical protein